VNGTVIGTVDVSNGLATINWTIPTTWIGGVYSIIAEYSGSANYLASNNTTNLTVNPTPTNVTLDPVSGFAGQTVTINTHVTDSNNNPVKDGKVTYKVNGTLIGTVDVSNGLATITWTIPTTWTTGTYNIIAEYSGSSNYLASTNGTSLTLQPSAYLYMNVTNSKNNPAIGEKFVLTYKLSNSGPDDAANVVVSFQIPEGLEFVTASVDSGTYTYNPTNRTITWTLNNVKVGDPYLYLTLQALTSGKYTIIPTIDSQTRNRNTDTIKPFNINIETPNNNDNNPTTSPTTANAASNTITMQKTGTPTTSLILAILAILGGILTPKKK
ncbi:Invasin/intimin cell-adhesion, partial [Syntrophomonas zehnderi OL-4]